MRLLRRRGSRDRADGLVRFFFATDIHGSDRCFRKFLAAARVYDAHALILGGDIAGKAIVPMTRSSNGRIIIGGEGQAESVDEQDSDAAISRIKDAGLYPRFCTAGEYERLGSDIEYREKVFDEVIAEQVGVWCELASERLDESVRLIITPGNDDPFVIDDILRGASRVECPERELLELGPVTLASLGNTNVTPWDTPREFSEDELAEQIDDMLSTATGDRKLVFNFHCPPKDSGLDTAAKLDENLAPVVVAGHIVNAPAGSSAVRDAIDRYRPVVGLHGHIHESAGVWRHAGTICLNPGSDYGSGVLKGAVVVFGADGSYRAHMLTTG